MMTAKPKIKHPKASPNPYHRNPNSVRTTPRKKFGSGPVVKGATFGRHEGRDPDGRRYT